MIPSRAAVVMIAMCGVIAAPRGLPARTTPPDQAPSVPQPPPQVPFRAGVDLVSLNVTVSDSGGKYITDLTAEDFSVFEDGVKQEVTFFTRTNLPIALSLLMDTSASMETRLGIAQEAGIGFARKLRSQDLAEIVDFDSMVKIAQVFTNDASLLEKAIRQTSAGGSTSLYNAVYIALKDLQKLVLSKGDAVRRQVSRECHPCPGSLRERIRGRVAATDAE